MIKSGRRDLKLKKKKKVESVQVNTQIQKAARAELVEAFECEQKLPISSAAADAITTASAVDKNVLYVGQQEMEALQVQEYIQQEMAQHWSLPAGMRKDLSCILKYALLLMVLLPQ